MQATKPRAYIVGEVAIVENQSAYMDALFNPIVRPETGRKGTADGYIVRRGKRFVELWINGKHYTINKWGVWCFGLKGDASYLYPDDCPLSRRADQREFSQLLAVSTEPRTVENFSETLHTFKA
jgi:hypothetical protein